VEHEELKNSIAAYCLGALAPEEARQVEAQLEQGDPEILKIYGEMQRVVRAMPFAVPEKEPPPTLKKNLFAAIEANALRSQATAAASPAVQDEKRLDVIESAKAWWMRLSFGLAFVALTLAVGLGWYSHALKGRLDAIENQLLMSGRLIEALRTEISNKERILNVVNSPGIQLVKLDGLEASPSSKGTVYWAPAQNKAVVAIFDLPAPPSDKDYQLWMLRGNQPVDAGILPVSDSGQVVSSFDTISDGANLAAFAVTLEPKGGVPQPTGQMYLLGAVTKG